MSENNLIKSLGCAVVLIRFTTAVLTIDIIFYGQEPFSVST